MDYTAITTSLITGSVTALGTILGFISTMRAQRKKDYMDHVEASRKMQEDLEAKLEAHREEYLKGIKDVSAAVRDNSDKMSELKHQSEMFAALTEKTINELSERVEKHNQIVERTYALEKAVSLLDNREKVSEHRLTDLEGEAKNIG